MTQFPVTIHTDQSFEDPVGSRTGQTLGKYRVIGLLGRGGMGEVYEAEDTVLKRTVVLKTLPASFAGDKLTLDRFLAEARALARLSHPNVVAIHDVAQLDGVWCLVMELVRGGNAQQYLAARGAMEWREATRVIIEACRGLAAAHAAGVVHRDIKPSNLMRSVEGGVVKLADFGLAKTNDAPSDGDKPVVGTPAYMSPEQCRTGACDERSDIYSMGATYYALLAGQQPFVAASDESVMKAHCSQPTPDPRDTQAGVPEACVAIVRRAMDKQPGYRYASADQMRQALEDLLAADGHRDASARWEQFVQEAVERRAAALAAQHQRRGVVYWVTLVFLAIVLALVIDGVIYFLYVQRHGAPVAGGGKDPMASGLPGMEASPALGPPLPAPIRSVMRASIPPGGRVLPMGGRVEAVVFSPNGRYLAAGASDGTGATKVWNYFTGQEVTMRAQGLVVRSLCFSRDNQWLASGGSSAKGHTLSLWSPITHVERWVDLPDVATVRALDFAPGGKVLAIGTEPQTKSPAATYGLLWETLEGRVRSPLAEHPGPVAVLGVLPDGKRLLAGGADGVLRLASLADGRVIQTFGIGAQATDLSISADGETFAVATTKGAQVWRIDPPQPLLQYGIGPSTSVALSPDGRQLAVGTPTGDIHRWTLPDGAEMLPLRGHSDTVRALAFAYDSCVLASGGWDATLRLWDVSLPLP